MQDGPPPCDVHPLNSLRRVDGLILETEPGPDWITR